MFYPYAHDQTGDSEERLDDSWDESADTVDFPSGENSASSDRSEEESLASQKTFCDGGERKPAKRKCCHDYEGPHSLERKAKLAIFFTVYGLRNKNMILFAGRSRS